MAALAEREGTSAAAVGNLNNVLMQVCGGGRACVG